MTTEQSAAAQAPREVPRLTDAQIHAAFDGSVADYVDITDDEVTAFARTVESRVRELCGVAP